MDQDEYTFLCGYQKIRRYGSTSDLNTHNYSSNLNRYSRIIVHRVEPTDTLQSLELKYNSSMYEIKRLNRLWSNSSLHCKTHLNIPLFDDLVVNSSNSNILKSKVSSSFESNAIISGSLSGIAVDANRQQSTNLKHNDKRCLEKVEEANDESLDHFFRRIDRNVKKTQKIVRKLNKTGFNSLDV